ncbi:hypothetical protein CYMTET_46910, partial [Cymbomonas tetramitiformis]
MFPASKRKEENGQERASLSNCSADLTDQIRRCKTARWEQGLAKFQDLQQFGIVPDVAAYSATIELTLRAQKHRTALTVMESMVIDLPSQVKYAHFVSVLSLCLRGADWTHTMKTLELVSKLSNYELYNKLAEKTLRHYLANKSYSALLLTVQKLDFSLHQLSERKFADIMVVCINAHLHNSSFTAMDFLAQLRAFGHKLQPSHCHAAVVALVQAKLEGAAEQLFHAMMSDPQNEFTYEQCQFLNRCCVQQGAENLKLTLTYGKLRGNSENSSAADMPSKDLTSANSYNAKMVESFVRGGNWESVLELVEPALVSLQECPQGGDLLRQLPTSAYKDLVVALCELEKYAEVLRVFEQLWHQLPSCLDAEAWRAIIYSSKMSNCRDMWPMLAERLRISLVNNATKGPLVEILCCELLHGLGTHHFVAESYAFFRALHTDEMQQERGLLVYCSMVEVLWGNTSFMEAIRCVTEGMVEGRLQSILPIEEDDDLDTFWLHLGPMYPRTTCAIALLWFSQLYNMCFDGKDLKPRTFLTIYTNMLPRPFITKGERLMVSSKPDAEPELFGRMLTELGFSFKQTYGYVITWDSFASTRPITPAASDRDNPWALHVTAETLSQRLSVLNSMDLPQSSLSKHFFASQSQSSPQGTCGAVVPADPSAPASAGSRPLPDSSGLIGVSTPQGPFLLPPSKHPTCEAMEVSLSSGCSSSPYGGLAPKVSSPLPCPPGLLRGTCGLSMKKSVFDGHGTPTTRTSVASSWKTAYISQQAAPTGGMNSSFNGSEVTATARDATAAEEQSASLGSTAGSTGGDATLAGGETCSYRGEVAATGRDTAEEQSASLGSTAGSTGGDATLAGGETCSYRGEVTATGRDATAAEEQSASLGSTAGSTGGDATLAGGETCSYRGEVTATGRDATAAEEQSASLGSTAGSTGGDATLAGGENVAASDEKIAEKSESVKADGKSVNSGKTASTSGAMTVTTCKQAARPGREDTLPVPNLQTREKTRAQNTTAGKVGPSFDGAKNNKEESVDSKPIWRTDGSDGQVSVKSQHFKVPDCEDKVEVIMMMELYTRFKYIESPMNFTAMVLKAIVVAAFVFVVCPWRYVLKDGTVYFEITQCLLNIYLLLPMVWNLVLQFVSPQLRLASGPWEWLHLQ